MARKPVAGPVVIPNCVELKLNWSNGPITYSNIWHGQFTGGGAVPGTLAETLFAAFKAALTSSGLAGHLAPDTSFNGVSVKDLRSPNMPWSDSVGTAIAGSGAGPDLAESIAIVVTQKTANTGRGFRGRSYIGGLDASAQASSTTHSAAAGTAAAAWMTACQAAMSSNSVPLAVGQRALQAGTDSHGNALPPRAANVVPVTQCSITSQRLDTQRRRLGR